MRIEAVCEICKKEFAKKTSLKGHMQKYHVVMSEILRLSSFACPFCPKSFPYRFDLNRHIKNLHCRPYRCILPSSMLKEDQLNCNANFSCLSKLIYHICSVHKSEMPKSGLRDLIVKNSDPVFELGDFDGGSNVLADLESICPFEGCDKIFRSYPQLLIHIRRHGDAPHQCEFCSAKFTFRGDLTAHQRDKTLSCYDWVIERQKLKRYLKNPSREPKVCEICGIKLAASSLHRHMKIEHGIIISHICQICGYATKSKSMFESHLRNEAKKQQAKDAHKSRVTETNKHALDSDSTVESASKRSRTHKQDSNPNPVRNEEVQQSYFDESDCESVIVCIQSDCDSPRVSQFASSPVVCIPSHFPLARNVSFAPVEEVKYLHNRIALFDDESVAEDQDDETETADKSQINYVDASDSAEENKDSSDSEEGAEQQVEPATSNQMKPVEESVESDIAMDECQLPEDYQVGEGYSLSDSDDDDSKNPSLAREKAGREEEDEEEMVDQHPVDAEYSYEEDYTSSSSCDVLELKAEDGNVSECAIVKALSDQMELVDLSTGESAGPDDSDMTSDPGSEVRSIQDIDADNDEAAGVKALEYKVESTENPELGSTQYIEVADSIKSDGAHDVCSTWLDYSEGRAVEHSIMEEQHEEELTAQEVEEEGSAICPAAKNSAESLEQALESEAHADDQILCQHVGDKVHEGETEEDSALIPPADSDPAIAGESGLALGESGSTAVEQPEALVSSEVEMEKSIEAVAGEEVVTNGKLPTPAEMEELADALFRD